MTTYRSERGADEHARHDQPLIVAYASGDLLADEARSARELIASCHDCASLVDEIRLVSTALANDVGAPRRPRDFRLRDEDAARLQAGLVTRLLRRVGGPGMTMLQPLAGAATAIGLVLVVATAAFPGFGLGAGGASGRFSAASDSRTDLSSRGAPATVPGGARQSGLPETAAPLPAALASPVPSDAYVPDVGGAIDNPGQPTKSLPFDQVPGVDPALLVGIVLVVAGTALLVLRLVARRLAEDPLLR